MRSSGDLKWRHGEYSARDSATPYRLLDRIERGDALKGFARDRRRTALGDVKELSSQMCPAEGERDRVAGSRIIGNVLVGRVSIALHDAAIGLEQLQRVDGAAAWCIGVGD